MHSLFQLIGWKLTSRRRRRRRRLDQRVEAALKKYLHDREEALDRELKMGFEAAIKNASLYKRPTDLELSADRTLQLMKQHDIDTYYRGSETDSLGQAHPHFYGDHFLHNVNIIERTKLFRLCQGMPKGAHLHIHFNANCHPSFLLNIAKEMNHMYIWSTKALTNKEAFQRCEIRFSILSEQNLKKKNPLGNLNILSSEYKTYEDLKDRGETGWMSYKTFRMLFPQHKIEGVEKDVDKWLLSKLVFSAEEAYNSRQCAAGMMKGLFNYQTAFVRYTQACLEEFARDNIQYAEIRLDFMPNNQLWDDEGKDQMSNERMMELIIEGYNAFQLRHQRKVFKGLKVIYCTPRSFDKPKIVFALNQCIEFKKKFPEFIAGFDLVGEKGNGNKYPLKHFAEELLEFRHKCKAENLDIPFLFHCGETLENGTDADHDLIDAILLGAKRIAHGYAVPWHPWVMQQLKARNICIELCPISNEILGLTSRIGGHSAYTALANDIVACVNTDHGGLFRSTLAHEFYQIMAGKRNMTLIDFRQLAYWSLEFSCMTPAEKNAVIDDWEKMWSYFVLRIFAGDFGLLGHSSSSQPASHAGAAAPHSSRPGSSGAAEWHHRRETPEALLGA
ncbi:hypothetical protein MYCTH_2119593 [Thermothelomyces thermophilus ATCC 42464]|uniref:adenosine deaminase n=1 Tax=Thermothelomyces thermophilus (strain ATCC 42464 / BCRC 31852 / DSM 1799) TaxID=573729 RepID=G2QG97_THET4|nr:uncharacterized protein MYCTH_2119593 [Thermothelomyces thermophilus ATCC 42464]AEO59357.1 hypothetical protein MYCTH_2119593 [Thermothelomyces thermophilus ATCC 42464]